MGFLKEQTGNYVVHYASIHLAAVRYSLFFNLMLENGNLSFGEIRSKITGQLEKLSFATVLWELFKSLIHGTLDRFEQCIGIKMIKAIKDAIDCTVENFLQRALMDDASCQKQIKAEALGVILPENFMYLKPKCEKQYPNRKMFAYAFANMPYTLRMRAEDRIRSIFADAQLVMKMKDDDLIFNAAVELDIRDAKTREINFSVPGRIMLQ